jgi:hypothetical protein
MVKDGNRCKNARNSLVAATFEKANTYVFAAPIIRDREVGGSNPLAPTNQLQFTQTITADSHCQPFFLAWPICGQNFLIHGINLYSL